MSFFKRRCNPIDTLEDKEMRILLERIYNCILAEEARVNSHEHIERTSARDLKGEVSDSTWNKVYKNFFRYSDGEINGKRVVINRIRELIEYSINEKRKEIALFEGKS